jgi:hypothetical protein
MGCLHTLDLLDPMVGLVSCAWPKPQHHGPAWGKVGARFAESQGSKGRVYLACTEALGYPLLELMAHGFWIYHIRNTPSLLESSSMTSDEDITPLDAPAGPPTIMKVPMTRARMR